MIVYTVDQGEYITIEESLRRQPEGRRSLYVNLTNRCNCACTFCLRELKKMDSSMTLWLQEEPTVAAVQAMLDDVRWEYVRSWSSAALVSRPCAWPTCWRCSAM